MLQPGLPLKTCFLGNKNKKHLIFFTCFRVLTCIFLYFLGAFVVGEATSAEQASQCHHGSPRNRAEASEARGEAHSHSVEEKARWKKTYL